MPEETYAIVPDKGGKSLFWLKKTGDVVKKGERVASLEAGKGASFVTAPVDGVIDEIVVRSGKMTKPGEPIGYIVPTS